MHLIVPSFIFFFEVVHFPWVPYLFSFFATDISAWFAYTFRGKALLTGIGVPMGTVPPVDRTVTGITDRTSTAPGFL